MPSDVNGVLRYDINDEADLADLIRAGLIWKGGPKAVAAAVAYLQAHPEAMNSLVPASVSAAIHAQKTAAQETVSDDEQAPTTSPEVPPAPLG